MVPAWASRFAGASSWPTAGKSSRATSGAEVEAATGYEGLQSFAGLRPDIVLLDLGLPDRDGAAVLAEIRDRFETPVIVISVRDREADIVALLDGGADDYVTKPFAIGELEQGSLRLHLSSMRKKMERDPSRGSARPRLIVTEPGIGYRLRN